MSAIHPKLGNVSSLRRSQRVHIRVGVMVAVRGGNEERSSEAIKTLLVSAHGALILLRMAVTVGEVLALRNAQTHEEALCRVVAVEPSGEPKMTKVGIEFIEPAPRFWGVYFPPEGSTSHSDEAKGYTPQVGMTFSEGARK
jgi:PilZ domain